MYVVTPPSVCEVSGIAFNNLMIPEMFEISQNAPAKEDPEGMVTLSALRIFYANKI